MVGSAPQSQSQSLSAEEEALKRNTDCVYFLASPLTCKKGNECEYRHSDLARVNPRDCYFWLHGNCLNPKCAFRHPPLEGLLGTQVPTSTGPSAPPVSQPVAAPTPHVPSASTKPGVPCIFFQKGYCLKGDWCPFLHVPISLSNKPSVPAVTTTPAEPATNKKALSGLEKSVPETKAPPVNVAKSFKDSAGAKSTFEVEPAAPPRNEFAINRRAAQTTPISNGNPVTWPVCFQKFHHLDKPEPENMNSKDTEDVSREPSPGFDVLVDDDVRDSDYYPGEDRYGMSSEHESRNEYDIGLCNDYNTMTAFDDERYQGRSIGYDSHEHRKGQYGYEQHRASSERSGGSDFERRPYGRPDNVSQVDDLDLRHRLAKHKKPNGLRSVISHENARELNVGDRSYRGLLMEENRSLSREHTLGNRLRGRISLPRRSLSPHNRDIHRGRLSPLIRANMFSDQGRIRDSIRGRVDEGFNNSGKNYNRGPYSRRDNVGGGNFAGPKSLAELKNRKNGEPPRKQNVTGHQSVVKRKHMHEESRNELSFEGPKPLEEILKRKRGETYRNTSNNNEGIVEDKIQEEGKEVVTNNEITSIGKNKEVYNSTSVRENEVEPFNRKQEVEDGMLDDGVDQNSEAYEVRDGESDYEQVGGEDFDLDDGENGDNVEYADEDDDDDFAKKMGVMYS